ncbi:aminopeptidase [Amycolatopsis acidiphila]|nr:aminopeptidase [Amycolatopsis acidiphila]
MRRGLSRSEASRRSARTTVRSYDVALDLTPGDDTFRSTTTIRFAADGEPAFAELVPRRLCSASLNGVPCDTFSPGAGRLSLTGLEDENELVVVADMAYAGDGQGVHRHVDPADGRTYLYASSALTAAPRWFACFDQPDLKAPLRLSLRCPEDWTVVGNGGAATFAEGWWRTPATPPLSPHLAGFIAGPYHSHTATHDGVPLGVHVRRSRVDSALTSELLAETARLLDEFHRLLDARYPWGEYHQAFVPDLPWRGMENPGCVLYREPLLTRRSERTRLMAHELAHMWFGDLVTMRWWDDLWLHESFAEYLADRVLATGSLAPADQLGADARPSTHPVADADVRYADEAYLAMDAIIYTKGAVVLDQLARRIGHEAFVRGLRAHLAGPTNTSYDDFVESWSAVAGPGFDDWARRWLRTSGLDTVRVAGNRLLRSGSRPHHLSVAAFGFDGGELRRDLLAVDDESNDLPVPPVATALVLPNADGRSWVKIQLAAEEWRRMPALLPKLDEQARRMVWTALRSGVEDGELDPEFAVELGVATFPFESSAGVLGPAARWLTEVVLGTYLPDHGREQAERGLAGALGAAFHSAPTDSALQRTAARRWIDVAPAAALASLRHPRALERRCALGHYLPGRPGDPVHAARCRALVPGSEAKENAWAFILGDAPAEERYAAARAFWHPAHRRLTEPFVARYFDDIPRVDGGIEAARLARFAFPRTADASALRAAASLLDSPGLDAGVRHAVADGADELRRALWRPSRIGNMVSPLAL